MHSHRTAALLACAAFLGPGVAQAAEPSLEGRAVLPADTFDEGSPPSGASTGPGNGRTTPFDDQPVMGFSAVLDAGGGSYWAMPDNGYGAKANSGDFLLRMYRVRPEFKTASGGSGAVAVEDFKQLSDPDEHVPFDIQQEADGPARLLTGFDFDIESVRRAADGDLWFGEEYGPFLLHTDSTGKLLEPPISPPPGVLGVDNSLRGSQPHTLGSSRGFEGMGLSTDGPCGTDPGAETLHPMLQRQLEGETNTRRRFLYSFSIATGEYLPQSWQYPAESTGYHISDVSHVDEHRLLVLERDNLQGAAANFKRVYLVDLRVVDGNGYLVKSEVANLLQISDPDGVSLPGRLGDFGLGDPFEFPFMNVEALLPLDRERLLVLNDNNYPYDNGRSPNHPDDDEAIVIRIDALCEAPGPSPVIVPQLPGGVAAMPAPDRVRPSVRDFRATPSRFRVARGATRLVARNAAARRGTVFRYRLNEKGRVTIRIDRARRARRGLTFRRSGVLSRRTLRARGTVRFSGRLGRRTLAPGRYRARITPTDAAGNRGRPRRTMLRIVR